MAHFTKNDYKYFDMARRIAMTSEFKSFKLGCVIVYKNRVISTGVNSNKTHPIQKKYNKKYRKFNEDGRKPIKSSLHAEIQAIISVPKCVEENLDWSDAKVYVYRYAKGLPFHQGNSCSCPACRALMRDKGIRHLYYSGDGNSFVYEKLY